MKKHGVSFKAAKTVFDNSLTVIFSNEAHSTDDVREIIIGHSQSGRLRLIAFAERQDNVEIISAPQRPEREDYEQNTF